MAARSVEGLEGELGKKTHLSLPPFRSPEALLLVFLSLQPATPTSTLTEALSPGLEPVPAELNGPVLAGSRGPNTLAETVVRPWETRA